MSVAIQFTQNFLGVQPKCSQVCKFVKNFRSDLLGVRTAGIEVPCKLVEVSAHLAALGKQSGNSGQGFFAAAGNDDRFLDLDVVDGAADKSGEGEMVNCFDAPFAQQYMQLFDQLWNDREKLEDVTDVVIENISTAYAENSPEFIYFLTLYHVFSEFLDDISEDELPNEATGFKQSKIWSLLYDFQKDAALAIINKLEKYNGCILADSVGLGKTFTALAVIKYYENRNKSVLVLCPKKLAENWNTYKDNYVNNPIASDRLNYTVLFHTDLSRTGGQSNGIQDYVFTDGSAEKSVKRKFAESLDGADEVFIYAKLPRGFFIPTPVGHYSPDWAIVFHEGAVKHIYFVAETKGTMESLNLRPIEKSKIDCAKKLFAKLSDGLVIYDHVSNYQELLNKVLK